MIQIEKIVEIISTAGVVEDIGKFDPNLTFKQNGIDSLDVFTIFLAVEEQLGVKFSEEDTLQVKSASDMLNFINAL